MHVIKAVLLLVGNIVTGSAFVISCGDNWHFGTDAGVDAPKAIDAAPVCHCPTAEPQLAGRFVVSGNQRTVPANERSVSGAVCPAGMLIISGSCIIDNATAHRNVSLEQSGFYEIPPMGWTCALLNNEPIPVSIRASVICLEPKL